MGKVDIIQSSFAVGEIGPSLYGRSDLNAWWGNAVEICKNFIPRPYGSALSAPGTTYVATVSDSTLNTRLIKFVFNRTDSYILEMGDLYMRFFTNRGQIGSASGTEDLSAHSGSLTAHWKLNDDAANTTVDDATTSHDGTSSTNTNNLAATGVVGGAFNFNTTDYFSVADSDDFTRTASTQPMTILAWVYYGNNGNSQTIISKWSPPNGREYRLFVSSTDILKFNLFDDSAGQQATWSTDDPLPTGWNFIAVTFAGDGTNSNDAKIYVNGAIADVSTSISGTFVAMENTAAPIKVGARGVTDGGTDLWANRIDNVAFIQDELTSTEIAALYTTTAYQIATVYTESELNKIQTAQINDVIYMAHVNHPPQQLTRVASSEWTIANFAFVGGPFLDENTDDSITITASATTGTVNITVSPTNSNLFTVSASTLGHVNSYWMIGGLAQTNATTGLEEFGYVKITDVINTYTATATVIKNLKVSTATAVWAEGAWSAVRGYPSAVTLHDNRLCFAGTTAEPQKVWASKVFEYENFALGTQADDDAMNLALASTESNEIQWLESSRSLIAGTYNGVFPISSPEGTVLTPDNVQARDNVGFGCSDIEPMHLGSYVYFIQRFKKRLRELFYLWENDTYKATDSTIRAPHIFGDGAVEGDVAEVPDPVMSFVVTDGTIANFVREPDQEQFAWSSRTTDGTFTSIAIIPSQAADYDEAWVIAERWINGVQKKYVEYINSPEVPVRQDLCQYLDSALCYSAYGSTATSSVTLTLTATDGTMTMSASTAYFAAGDVNDRIRAINTVDGTVLGEAVITAHTSGTEVTASITTIFTAASYVAGDWGKSVTVLSGLDHIEDKTVGILADGQVESLTKSVSSNSITLDSDAFVVNIGLSYDQIIKTLPKEAGNARGSARGKFQRYNEVIFNVNRSTQDFQYGTGADSLDNVIQAFTPTVTTLYTGVIPSGEGGLAMRGGHNRDASIYIKNSNPLPIELLNIMGTLDSYEK
jgi:hypothetical protein